MSFSKASLSQEWLAVPATVFFCSCSPVLANFCTADNLTLDHIVPNTHWCAVFFFAGMFVFKRLIQPSAWSSKDFCVLFGSSTVKDEGLHAGAKNHTMPKTLSTNLGDLSSLAAGVTPSASDIPHHFSARTLVASPQRSTTAW